MASSLSNGDRPLQGFRRSFTVPNRALSHHEKAGLDRSDAAAELLYSHPSARILSFTPPADSIISSSTVTLPDTDYPVDTVETLPWRSRTENLMASGLMVLEKVRGSTNFLKSGSVMHAILRNSQCWCVDGESKFVLRVRKFQYYRIELPSSTDEDKARVEELKQVLSKILRFESSPCPFKRGFHVDLPDDAITPRRKGQWKRREGSLSSTADADSPPLRRTKNPRAWSMQAASPLGNNGLRRGSDFGFNTGNEESPRQQYQSSDGRSLTPSSHASSEDLADHLGQREPDEGSSRGSESDVDHQELEKGQERPPSPENEEIGDLEDSIASHKGASNTEDDGDDGEKEDAGPEVDEPAPVVGNEEAVENSNTSQAPEPDSANYAVQTVGSTEAATEAEPVADNIHEAHEQKAAEAELPLLEEKTPIDEMPAKSDLADVILHESADNHSILTHTDAPNLKDNNDIPIETVSDDMRQTAEDNDLTEGHSNTTLFQETLGEPVIKPSTVEEQEEALFGDARDVEEAQDDAISIVSSVDSFHTLDSSEQELTNESSIDFDKTPMAERYDPMGMKDRQHKRDISEITVTASTVDEQIDQNNLDRFTTSEETPADKPATPTLARSSASDSSWPDIQTPSSPTLIQDKLRRRLNSHRSLSPLPSSTNVFSPPKHNQGNHLTSAILQKACNVALIKPIEVVVLLVHILARIAGGATVNDLISGDLFKRPEQEPQPHRRNASFPDHMAAASSHGQGDGEDDEDDYGVPLRGRRRVESDPGASLEKESDADSLFDLD